MENLVVDLSGTAVVGDAGGVVVGMRVAGPVRVVSALPLVGSLLSAPCALAPVVADPSASLVIGGPGKVYVSRMVWAGR